MPNWCRNDVTFKGTAEQIKKVKDIFKKMIAAEAVTQLGQKPDIQEDTNGYYMFNISPQVEEEEEASYSYDTKWSPNIEMMVNFSTIMGVDVEGEYEETGMLIFGFYSHKNGETRITDLEDEDWRRISFNENGDCLFDGEVIESEYEVLEMLLDKRKQIQGHE